MPTIHCVMEGGDAFETCGESWCSIQVSSANTQAHNYEHAITIPSWVNGRPPCLAKFTNGLVWAVNQWSHMRHPENKFDLDLHTEACFIYSSWYRYIFWWTPSLNYTNVYLCDSSRINPSWDVLWCPLTLSWWDSTPKVHPLRIRLVPSGVPALMSRCN